MNEATLQGLQQEKVGKEQKRAASSDPWQHAVGRRGYQLSSSLLPPS